MPGRKAGSWTDIQRFYRSTLDRMEGSKKKRMQGDGHLAGQIVVWSSILGMFSLFLIVFLFRMWGLL